MNVETIVTFLIAQGADFRLKILGALAAWIVGRWLIGLVLRASGAALAHGQQVDTTRANGLRSNNHQSQVSFNTHQATVATFVAAGYPLPEIPINPRARG